MVIYIAECIQACLAVEETVERIVVHILSLDRLAVAGVYIASSIVAEPGSSRGE
jgi:hypothetical protein